MTIIDSDGFKQKIYTDVALQFCPLWTASQSDCERKWWTWWIALQSRRRCSSKYPPPLQSPSLTPLGRRKQYLDRTTKKKPQKTATMLTWSLTSWCILWYTFASLSRTTNDWEGVASPLKMKLRSPRWHFISLKSMRVVSSLNQERGMEE